MITYTFHLALGRQRQVGPWSSLVHQPNLLGEFWVSERDPCSDVTTGVINVL